ncbi:MAG: thiamine biosynthesis protein ThiJ [Bacteroidetes bacterium]|nr:MAG: thiamine biosynthesis protein ThiJ [Bacteroidota bacterium]
MKIAFIIFNEITWLDLIGVYDAIFRLKHMNFVPGLEWDICAQTNLAADHYGLTIIPNKINQPLDSYDVIIVPGGYGTRTLTNDENFVNWIRTAQNAKWKISICTGSLILGAAGFLKNKKATTHFSEYETLKLFCKEVSEDRIVEDGDTITAGAVSSSLDLGLYLSRKWAGDEAAKIIRERMAYHG